MSLTGNTPCEGVMSYRGLSTLEALINCKFRGLRDDDVPSRALFDALAGGECAAHACVARGVQRRALYREDGRPMALDAERPAAMGDRLPAGAAMAEGGMLRDSG